MKLNSIHVFVLVLYSEHRQSSIHVESMGSNNVHKQDKEPYHYNPIKQQKGPCKRAICLSIHFPDHDQMRKKNLLFYSTFC